MARTIATKRKRAIATKPSSALHALLARLFRRGHKKKLHCKLARECELKGALAALRVALDQSNGQPKMFKRLVDELPRHRFEITKSKLHASEGVRAEYVGVIKTKYFKFDVVVVWWSGVVVLDTILITGPKKNTRSTKSTRSTGHALLTFQSMGPRVPVLQTSSKFPAYLTNMVERLIGHKRSTRQVNA